MTQCGRKGQEEVAEVYNGGCSVLSQIVGVIQKDKVEYISGGRENICKALWLGG